MLGMEGHEARLVRLRQQLLTLFALLPVLCSTSHAATCRQGPLASAEFCALPVGLGNFQGAIALQPVEHMLQSACCGTLRGPLCMPEQPMCLVA